MENYYDISEKDFDEILKKVTDRVEEKFLKKGVYDQSLRDSVINTVSNKIKKEMKPYMLTDS